MYDLVEPYSIISGPDHNQDSHRTDMRYRNQLPIGYEDTPIVFN